MSGIRPDIKYLIFKDGYPAYRISEAGYPISDWISVIRADVLPEIQPDNWQTGYLAEYPGYKSGWISSLPPIYWLDAALWIIFFFFYPFVRKPLANTTNHKLLALIDDLLRPVFTYKRIHYIQQMFIFVISLIPSLTWCIVPHNLCTEVRIRIWNFDGSGSDFLARSSNRESPYIL